MVELRILYDDKRHLITDPYSLENLHLAAKILGIKRCWFHGKEPYAHYDIPKRQADLSPTEWMLASSHNLLVLEDDGFDIDILSEMKIEKVSTREILEVIHKWRLNSTLKVRNISHC